MRESEWQRWQLAETENHERLERYLRREDMKLNRGIEKRLCITALEAAEMLGISSNFAYELAKPGQLPVVKFGKRLLIPRAALDRMLEAGIVANNPKMG